MTGLEFAALIADEYQIMHNDCKCQSRHPEDECSIEVTYRAISCIYDWIVCTNFVTREKTFMYRGGYCGDCRRPAVDCWRFIPI